MTIIMTMIQIKWLEKVQHILKVHNVTHVDRPSHWLTGHYTLESLFLETDLIDREFPWMSNWYSKWRQKSFIQLKAELFINKCHWYIKKVLKKHTSESCSVIFFHYKRISIYNEEKREKYIHAICLDVSNN